MTVATNLEDERRTLSFKEIGPAERGKRPDEVVIARFGQVLDAVSLASGLEPGLPSRINDA